MKCPICRNKVKWTTEKLNDRVMYIIRCDCLRGAPIQTLYWDNLGKCLEEWDIIYNELKEMYE